jgi:glycosyltransferase involved in cell wall biosynthesis
MKAFALLWSRFEEVILVDADNVALADPAALFETLPYQRHGAVLWPDLSKLERTEPIWEICGIPYRDEPAVESGQIVAHKRRCWRALSLALWFNEHSDYFYQLLHGDKDTFHLAFRKLEMPYAMPGHRVRSLKATMCQHNFQGRRIFQHRNLDKWRLDGRNLRVEGFREEAVCRSLLEQLRQELRLPPLPVIIPNVGEAILPKEKAAARKPARLRCEPRRGGGEMVLRAPVNGYTGYGLHACQICTDLVELGVDVRLAPTRLSETFVGVPETIRQRFISANSGHQWELVLHPPTYKPPQNGRIVYFTMWETTRLSPLAVTNLNQAELVLVPCRWNAVCFRASGVTRPIQVIPLGINTSVFRYAPMDVTGPCIFGAGGRLADSDPKRKRVDDVIELFQEAFPVESDALLYLKVFPDCELPDVSDSRVRIIRKYYTEAEMAAWYRGLTCFVSTARAEGWGLMPHQALATGRPVITAAYGGVAEYFDASIGYEIPYDIVPADGRFAGLGMWSQPDRTAIVSAMRRVYRDRLEAAELGRAGAGRLKRLSWQNANRELLAALQDAGFLPAIEEPKPLLKHDAAD